MPFTNEDFLRIIAQKGYTVVDPRRYPVPSVTLNTSDNLVATLPDPKPQHDAGEKPLGADQDETRCPHRIAVRITRLATRMLDVDNLGGGCKYLIDAMRKERLIPDDDPASVDISFHQRKVKTRKECGTLIEIL